MSVQTLTMSRWTCDRCSTITDVPEADESEIPPAWSCIAITAEDSNGEPRTADLCPVCAGELVRFLKVDLA